MYNLVTSDGIDEKKFYKLLKQKEIIDVVVEKTEQEEEAVLRTTAGMDKELIQEYKKIMRADEKKKNKKKA